MTYSYITVVLIALLPQYFHELLKIQNSKEQFKKKYGYT